MHKNKHKKVCIISTSLAKGGAERSSAQLSKMLSELDYEVHIVTVISEIDFDYNGTLLDLGKLKNNSNSSKNQIERFLALRAYIKNHKFDVIIDNRTRIEGLKELMISKFLYTVKTVYVIHSHETSLTFPKTKWLNKLIYQNVQMTAVSKAIKSKFQSLYKLKNVETIYNGFDFEDIRLKSETEIELPEGDFILFYGRLDAYQKNIGLLLDAYKASKLPGKNIRLVILGDGPDKADLKQYVFDQTISDYVIFKAYTKNPYPFVKAAKFVVLSSRFEGFPMVIPETLSLGIPVLSVDCESGPSEVITNEHNGLLVENHNSKALAEGMNRLISDHELLKYCSENASDSVKQFDSKSIAQQWHNLLQKL
ncbi:MAG: glycosyltransferase [Psychroserpens sp.]|uniref:glycosyltransferase n=1 Tax=Psychroserpens sp. TaxID=2020870 RepID=UPI003001D90A